MALYQRLFNKLKTKNEGAFVPFVVIGDPNPKQSIAVIETLINSGADALELGIPFSDPSADGPIIQHASERALNAGVTQNTCFDIIQQIREKYKTIPIGLLIYANLVFVHGINKFYERCKNYNINSVLIADLPLEDSVIFRSAAMNNKIAQVFICPPNANKTLIKQISIYSYGYIYLLSRSGVTGLENRTSTSIPILIKKIKKHCNTPILQGFGISKYSQIHSAISSGMHGVISGSAIIKIIEQNIDESKNMIKKLKITITKMKKATII